MTGLRRIPEATRTPSFMGSRDVNGDQNEFDLVPRAILKTMFDIKPLTGSESFSPASGWVVVGGGGSLGSAVVVTKP